MNPLSAQARGTGNILQNRVVVDMSDKVALLKPRLYPLTVLTKKIGKQSCHNYKFEWMEDSLMSRWVTATANATSGATTFNVSSDDAALVAVDDLVKNTTTGEVVRVTGISGSTLTVVRSYGEIAAGAINSADKLLIVGNASMQGSGAPAEKYNKEQPNYNYTQIFKTPFSLTNTLNSTKVYGKKELAKLRMKKGIEHAQSIEYAFLFGDKKLDTTGDQPRTTTSGVLTFLKGTPNSLTIDRAVVADKKKQEEMLDEFLEKIFVYGSGKKTVLCSSSMLTWFASLAKERLTIQQASMKKTLGLEVTKYITPHGTLTLVPHPLLVGGYAGYGLILDLENIKYRPLGGRDTKLKTNIQKNDEDGIKDMYITEAGLELRQVSTHGLLIIK